MKNNIVPSLFCALLLVFMGTNVSAQQSASRTVMIDGKTYIDNGFFKYEIISNTDADAVSYQAAKIKFLQADPAGYDRWLESTTAKPAKHVIDKKEFAQLPKDRQDMILANPDKYEIKEITQ